MRITLIALNIFMRLGLNYLESWLSGTTDFDNPVTSAVGVFIPQAFSGGSNPLATQWTLITSVPDYMVKFMNVVLMWEPTVFAGDRVWLWWLIIMPFAVITALGIIFSFFAK